MIKLDYIYPIIFLLIPTLLALGLFIEQKVLSHGSYIYEIQDSNEWYNKDLDLKNMSWNEIKKEIRLFKNVLDTVSYNFASDTYDKNALHVLTMQAHKKLIVFKQYFTTIGPNDHSDYDQYKKILDDIEPVLQELISYNKNTIKPNYTSEFSNIVNIIYLPLAVITGYFGMNFASMGAHGPKNGGVYNETKGQFFVLTVAAIVILIYIYIMFETNKPYGSFDYIYKGKTKFTLYDYIFGKNTREKERKERKNINEDAVKDKIDEYNVKKYDKDNPPPSLKVYESEVTSLAPPIIRDKEIGPYDESLFEYQL
tara:strand:+ start:4843 stop:5775 length:933 start_codon:yes stop_codon:yes gene_type:complete